MKKVRKLLLEFRILFLIFSLIFNFSFIEEWLNKKLCIAENPETSQHFILLKMKMD